MIIVVDNSKVAVPAYVGIDRLRAQRAVVHTHDTTNQVWLEGRGVEEVTLGQFFAVWGVRFDGRCLGAACEDLSVTANGQPVSDPVGLRLAGVDEVEVFAPVLTRNPPVSHGSPSRPPTWGRMAE